MSIHITGDRVVQTSAFRLLRKAAKGTAKKQGQWLIVATLGVATLVVAGCASKQPYNESQASLIGPAGPAGAVGPAGAQGPTGYTGAPGAAMTGPRGAEGPSGPTGRRGPTGVTGPAGAVEVGQAGVAGASGPAGAQGERGWTGAQGASAAGYAGQTGPAGPAGARGERGETGAKGSTLVGPTGPAGAQGTTGAQGVTGETGFQGSTTAGVAGPAGGSGAVGEQGATGPMGAQGPAGVIGRWMSYRDSWFESGEAGIRPTDTSKVSDIAAYMKQNPSLQVGIDTFDTSSQDLRDRRVNAVRDALIHAGVPAEKIATGAFGDPKPRHNSRVEVLITTTQN